MTPRTQDERVAPGDAASGLRQTLHQHFGERTTPSADPDPGVVVAQAPGRVNLLGGHTDYNDGFVLPTTIDRSVHMAARRRDDATLRLYSTNFDEEATYTLGTGALDGLPGWARYVVGVAVELRRQGYAVTGVEAALSGNVPLGAGLSSSAALEVATAVGLDGLFSLGLEPVETARLCQHVEQEYVGVECGIMDQFSSRVGRADHALFLDCRSLDHEHLPLPMDEVCLVVADSGVRRELASSKYNERRHECEDAAAFFGEQTDREVRTLRDVSEEMLTAHGHDLPESLRRRARHVITENQRVERGTALLRKGDLEAFGSLMNASHDSLANDYEVSCDELDCLATVARRTEGVLGSRMTGAGFGGCTVTLVRCEAVPRLKRALRSRYEDRFDHDLEIYVVERTLEAGLL